jgi:hypothetical protein
MFMKQVSRLAKFSADKMGKSTLAAGEFLFAGLNTNFHFGFRTESSYTQPPLLVPAAILMCPQRTERFSVSRLPGHLAADSRRILVSLSETMDEN